MGIVLQLAVTDNVFSVSVAAVPIFREHSKTMSSSNNSNGTNGTITLKGFSELANVLDLESLPPGPPDDGDETQATTDNRLVTDAVSERGVVNQAPSASSQPLDLASVIAQLASVSSDLETMARSDARAREQATVELAQYETLAAERQQAERALAEARSVRATAELLVTEAFTEQARADAARHAAVARAAELTCTQLSAARRACPRRRRAGQSPASGSCPRRAPSA